MFQNMFPSRRAKEVSLYTPGINFLWTINSLRATAVQRNLAFKLKQYLFSRSWLDKVISELWMHFYKNAAKKIWFLIKLLLKTEYLYDVSPIG